MTTLTVSGMTCGHCEQKVEDALSGVDGVTSVRVDRELGTATVEGDADADVLVQAVEDAGYDASA